MILFWDSYLRQRARKPNPLAGKALLRTGPASVKVLLRGGGYSFPILELNLPDWLDQHLDLIHPNVFIYFSLRNSLKRQGFKI